MAVSFAADIRKLFRESDVTTMQRYKIDLSKYDDVKTRAGDIYARLVDGDMPCDQAWDADKLRLFKDWMDGGMLP
ncbi:MAG: hypothetical protein M1482_15985 [Chloroflexi bacterium]|nr:hypothetical protein [Chloroflexota bacterium]